MTTDHDAKGETTLTKRYHQTDPNQVADLRAYWEKRKGEPFDAYLSPFRLLSGNDSPAVAYRHGMEARDWLAFCNRLAATMKILRPWADTRRPICLREIWELLCDIRRAAACAGNAVTGKAMLPDAYRRTTLDFRSMLAAEVPMLARVCLLALQTEYGPLLDDREAHLTAADRERIDNKLRLQSAAEITITEKMVPGIHDLPGLSWWDDAWVYRAAKIARKLGLPHPDTQFRLLEWLPLSARDPRYDNNGRYITRREAAERREREAFERRLLDPTAHDHCAPIWL